MSITVHHTFNEIFETYTLIYATLFPHQKARETLLFTEDSTTNREQMYLHIEANHQLYLETFETHFKSTEKLFFFFNEENVMGLALAAILAKYPEWLDNLNDFSDDDLRRLILNTFFDKNESLSVAEVIGIIEQNFEEGASFDGAMEMVLVYQNPKKYFSELIHIIKLNIPALHEAMAVLDETVLQLLAEFNAPPPAYYEKYLNYYIYDPHKGYFTFYPTFVNPFYFIMTQGCPLFCGLLLNAEIDRSERKHKPKDVLVKQFKLLGDSSKMEILTLLKNEPMYNLQIANALNITAATTHGHMRLLLNQGFITSQKRDGKVFYALKQQHIRDLIDDLDALFF